MNKNKEYRIKLRQDPHSMLNYISKDIDIVVKTNTKDTIYILIPQDNYYDLGLESISAGDIRLETLGSVGTAGTIGSIAFSTIGTASTVSTTGTAQI